MASEVVWIRQLYPPGNIQYVLFHVLMLPSCYQCLSTHPSREAKPPSILRHDHQGYRSWAGIGRTLLCVRTLHHAALAFCISHDCRRVLVF